MLVVQSGKAEPRAPLQRMQGVKEGNGKSRKHLRGGEKRSGAFKSRKCFGYDIGKARARPSNTAIRDLLGNEKFNDAVGAWRAPKVGYSTQDIQKCNPNPKHPHLRIHTPPHPHIQADGINPSTRHSRADIARLILHPYPRTPVPRWGRYQRARPSSFPQPAFRIDHLHQYPSPFPSPGIASLRSVSPHCPVKMPKKCHGLDLRFLLVGNSPGDVASERGHRGRDGLFSERLFVSLCANTHGPSWQDTIRLGAVISP